jgi:Putative zinc-finger
VTARPCAGEPVSWLALERYRLGELPARKRRALETHLAACAACSACLAEAERPLPLPSLPALAATPARWGRMGRALREAWPMRLAAPVVTAGVGVVLALALFARPRPHDATLPGIKGGGVAISLVRERDGVIDHEATTFTSRDRWKVLVTCPTDRILFWDVMVVDGGAATFPLSPAGPIACGNHVPLPGAFRLAGHGPADVCLILAGDPVDRGPFSSPGRTMPPAPTACVALRPTP